MESGRRVKVAQGRYVPGGRETADPSTWTDDNVTAAAPLAFSAG
jgi:hypothetical protein